jgi:predicted anti-sigma-YlaC factor YlaD
MLTNDENKFLAHWAVQRTKKRRAGFNVGFPLGVLMVLGIFINIVTGWHKQAAAALRSDSSTILVIVLAAVAIVVFMSVFASRYQWEQKEQRYQELLAKQKAA